MDLDLYRYEVRVSTNPLVHGATSLLRFGREETKMIINRLSYVLILTMSVMLVSLTACAAGSTAPEMTSIPPTLVASQTVMPIPTEPQPTATAKTNAALNGDFEVNGHSLYMACVGTGAPTIVLEPGEGGTVSDMFDLQEKLGMRTTTCAYDRAQTGSSRSAQDIVNDLHALLDTAQVPGPYLLVGHSAGGMFVQLYARTYPDQVVGVLAMNPVPPAHPWLDEVSKLFSVQEYADEEAYYNGQNGESLDYLTSSEQVVAAPMPPDIPFEMLISTSAQCEDSTGPCMKSYPAYEKIMQEVTAAWPHGNFSQVATSHEIFRDDPDAVVTIVERILASK
jgi:Predicted hydrolases or acyltransferases (alpha/beta hydrolase superfamily)